MAKRFIDTDIFKKSYIRGLQGRYKLLFFYLITDCNHAGIWECDWDVAILRCGHDYTPESVKENMGDKVIFFDGGEKIFIPSFVEFQYGELNPENRAHKSVIDILKKYNLDKIKPLTRPLQGCKDMDKDKDMDKEQEDKGGVGEKEDELVYPFTSEKFMNAWNLLLEESYWKKKTNRALQAALKKLSTVSESVAIMAIEDSLAGSYKGIFPEKFKANNGEPKPYTEDANKFDKLTTQNFWGER